MFLWHYYSTILFIILHNIEDNHPFVNLLNVFLSGKKSDYPAVKIGVAHCQCMGEMQREREEKFKQKSRRAKWKYLSIN